MEVVGVVVAQLIAVYNFEQIWPPAGVHPRELLESIEARYGFMKKYGPTLGNAQPNQNGDIFENGTLIDGGGKYAIRQFSIFDDGAMISAFHSDHCVRFFNDITSWLREEFEFRVPVVPMDIYHKSEITVKFEKPVSGLFSTFDRINSAIAAGFKLDYPASSEPNVLRLDFGVDQNRGTIPRPLPFTLERRAKIPFAEECFFSGAPMDTEHHLEVLQAIEDAIP